MRSLGIGIIGAGRVGGALASVLSHRGWRIVGVFDLDEARAREAARAISCGVFESAERLADRSEILFLTVPDDALVGLCEDLGDYGDFRARFLFNTSGILPAKVMHLAGLDRSVYSIHPFGGIAGFREGENPFSGLFFGCEGDEPSRELAAKIVSDLEGISVEIDWSKKTAYHLAASLVANHGFALFEVCTDLLRLSGIPADSAAEMTVNIAKRAISNFEKLGFKDGLTGPVVRRDFTTIAQHIAIAGETGNLELYLAGLNKINRLLAEKKKD